MELIFFNQKIRLLLARLNLEPPWVSQNTSPHSFSLSLSVQHSLTHPELSVAVEMLSSVALINRALEVGDMNTVWKQLSSSATGLTNIEEENCQRWVPRMADRSHRCLSPAFAVSALLFSSQTLWLPCDHLFFPPVLIHFILCYANCLEWTIDIWYSLKYVNMLIRTIRALLYSCTNALLYPYKIILLL